MSAITIPKACFQRPINSPGDWLLISPRFYGRRRAPTASRMTLSVRLMQLTSPSIKIFIVAMPPPSMLLTGLSLQPIESWVSPGSR